MHRLTPLLRPRSIAVIGASDREHSVGRQTIHNLLTGGFEGRLYPVNPGRESVMDVPCFPALDALPETVDHVIFCVGDQHLEPALEAAIAHGAKAVTVMSQLIKEGDPEFAQRISRRILEAELLACGPNGMGFYNCHDGVWVCGFDTRENHVRGGNVTLISHSGSGMAGIVDCEERIDFNLAVSTGSEVSVGMADYMDFAIEEHQTRAIGLFMETARRPETLEAAFKKARDRGIPVVAIKVGRTELSARMAQSHSGAVAGKDAAFDALFDRYGVQRVDDMHELATALMLFAQPHPIPEQGALVALHDSGGERQLLIDLADSLHAPLTTLNENSVQELENCLDPGLPAINPLDAWGAGGDDADDIMADSLAIMMSDPQAALGAVVHDRAPNSSIYPEYLEYLRRGHERSGKPAVLVSNHQGSGSHPLAVAITREGFPVLDGIRPFLVGVRALLAWRDAQQRAPMDLPEIPGSALAQLRETLTSARGQALREADALELLAACGLSCNQSRTAHSQDEVTQAAMELGYPVVLKTAAEGQLHKTDQGGVYLDLKDSNDLMDAYADLADRLGPEVVVAPMAPPGGVELFLGMIRDEQFGPLVVLGFGGITMEALADTVCALPPFDAPTAHRLLGKLRARATLNASRGRPAPDLNAFADMAARFSVLITELGDQLTEVDLNPVIVHSEGCLAVDALVLPHHSPTTRTSTSPSHRRAL